MEHDDDFAHDRALLDAVPTFLSVGSLLKATPKAEGAARFIYLEASNESRDQQNEVILTKALEESAAFYKKFGNVDIDHLTHIGAKQGIPNYESYEIGRPVEVRIDGLRTFVKAQIYSGEGPAAQNANMFWSSITDLNPPKPWYPSVGGAIMGKEIVVDPATGAKHAVINKVRWSNIAVSRTPVNANLAAVSSQAFGPLAKSWGIALEKSLTAGYQTDSALMTGGDALRAGNGSGRKQGDDGRLIVTDYFRDFRDPFAKLVHDGEAGRTPADMARAAAQHFLLSPSEAARYVEMFFDDLKRSTKRGSQ